MHAEMTAQREAWVDYAKGICIILVVMLHSTLGVEAAAGADSWMHYLVEFAHPFRMPDFFLIAGLFLARRIEWEWPGYLDRKVVHFLYFYMLWLVIQFAMKAPLFVADAGLGATAFSFVESLVQPFGTLWFIYLLPVLFVVTKILKDVAPLLVFSAGAALEAFAPVTGITIVDYFCAYFVYFYAGYWLAPHIFEFAKSVAGKPVPALACLGGWAILNTYYVFNGLAGLPLVSLVLGFMGVAAIVTVSALLARVDWARAIRYCGAHSLVIYLAFPVGMGITRIVLIKSGLVPDLGLLSLIVTAAALVGALILFWLVRGTWADFLFRRPQWAHLPAVQESPSVVRS